MNFIEKFKPFVYKDEFIELPYRLFIPSLKTQKLYPLIVFLHGAGERGIDNVKQITANQGATIWVSNEIQRENPSFVLAPQCPENSWWGNYPKDNEAFEPNSILYTVMLVINKLIREYPIDEDRIYITGLSMGGFGTITLLKEFPDKFSAGVIVCGGGNLKNIEKIKNIHLWFFHAEDDSIVHVNFSRKLVKALKEIGGKVNYTEYPEGLLKNMGHDPHESWVLAYQDKSMLKWLFSNFKGGVV
ncbi:prolyl oligopeptidase family serine peptidase [Thermosipho ferrireducens]|uniref:Prolyl oligopeptidase family serine peptidase n=1 Tax=Thermosipho ferrireducens TaxID=2571116 RepID=A0ABX7S6T9_9BACT|nr:prolyl oligopeptidase family serine peptidase [Thermosipho ferrireducens]QTA37566.1 prolyl oligopeptidase family serine peptidase [Thermosipho ferrireducens]